jgi:hypothetical protein
MERKCYRLPVIRFGLVWLRLSGIWLLAFRRFAFPSLYVVVLIDNPPLQIALFPRITASP